MKKTLDVLINAPLYALYMFLSCLVVMFAEMLVVKLANWFIVTDYYSTSVIRAVVYSIGVNAILAAIAFREGFRNAKATPIATVISGTLATLLYSVFCLLFSFEAFCAGGVKSIAIIVKFGKAINSQMFVGTLDRFDIIPFFFVNCAIYIAIMTAFNTLGAYKRKLDRQEMNVTHINSEHEAQ